MDRKYWIVGNEVVKAIQEKDCDTVMKHLNEGFDIDTELMPNKPAIIICIECNSFDVGKLLINHGCCLSLRTSQGSTPLHLAVQLLNFDFVKLLLQNRADLTDKDSDGKTVLHIAAQMNSLRMTELLMRRATPELLNIVDNAGNIPFIYACSYGSATLVSYFLAKGCNVNGVYGTTLNSPLLSALSNHRYASDMTHELLNAGANINLMNKLGETPLLKALHILGTSNFSCATYLLFQNICCLLIDKGSEVNVRNSFGYSPLHLAVIMNNEILTRKLLNTGSFVNATNDLGFTPLFYACKLGLRKIASLLIDSGENSHHLKYYVNEHQWVSTAPLMDNSVLHYVIQRSKECQKLKNICRFVIRENLPKNIEKSAESLPLPRSLIQFVKLAC